MFKNVKVHVKQINVTILKIFELCFHFPGLEIMILLFKTTMYNSKIRLGNHLAWTHKLIRMFGTDKTSQSDVIYE